MKFQVKNGSIECIRINPNSEQSVVARFDEHLRIAPPHLINKLLADELKSLEEWLADREVIKDAPAEKNLLCLLPSLMNEAVEALDNIDGIDQESYSLLVAATERLHQKLLSAASMVDKSSRPLDEITHTEANKERIKYVKKDLL